MSRFERTPITNQDPKERVKNFDEVCLGYTEEEAVKEAQRCIQCKNPLCVPGCPVDIDIPAFIHEIAERNFERAYEILTDFSSLPAVCGRVCPQETQCEKNCVLGKRGEAIAIGKLERFAADWAIERGMCAEGPHEQNEIKVAIVGAGPAGITCAGELAKNGYDVTMFEALHKPGGVLVYGIPEFRLPNDTVVDVEINNLKNIGVEIITDVLIGRTITIDELFDQGYKAIFVGSGAGAPIFLGTPGENLSGIFSANEFLTRNNLMGGFLDSTDTPIQAGSKTVVIGGGNVAMDAARTALRLGSDVTVVYRRTRTELPARVEEVDHAEEEGVHFEFLTNPVRFIGDDNGNVVQMECIRMELGEPDESGRRRPIEIEGSEFIIDVDTVISALGTDANTIIPDTTEGLDTNKWGNILAGDDGITSREGVFAGGDVVTGAATVIEAMGAGKAAAKSMDEYIKSII